MCIVLLTALMDPELMTTAHSSWLCNGKKTYKKLCFYNKNLKVTLGPQIFSSIKSISLPKRLCSLTLLTRRKKEKREQMSKTSSSFLPLPLQAAPTHQTVQAFEFGQHIMKWSPPVKDSHSHDFCLGHFVSISHMEEGNRGIVSGSIQICICKLSKCLGLQLRMPAHYRPLVVPGWNKLPYNWTTNTACLWSFPPNSA